MLNGTTVGRILPVLAGVVLLAAGAAPLRAHPAADGGSFQVAFVNWIDLDRKVPQWYGAIAIRGAHSTVGAGSVAAVFNIDCKRERSRAGVRLRCSMQSETKPVGPHEFWMDPTVRSASLDMAADGMRHVVEWERGRVEATEATFVGDERATISRQTMRYARVSGSIYGDRIPSGKNARAPAFITHWTQIRGEHHVGDVVIDIRDDGTIRLERTIRLR